MKTKPTEKQLNFLQSRNIPLPEGITNNACHNMISYIRSGNGTVGKTEQERIAITINYSKKWVGKRVFCSRPISGTQHDPLGPGTIRWLVARRLDKVKMHKDFFLEEILHPFQGTFTSDSGITRVVGLSELKLEEE